MKRIIPLNEKQIALVEDNISVIKTVICSRIIIDKNIFGMEYDGKFFGIGDCCCGDEIFGKKS